MNGDNCSFVFPSAVLVGGDRDGGEEERGGLLQIISQHGRHAPFKMGVEGINSIEETHCEALLIFSMGNNDEIMVVILGIMTSGTYISGASSFVTSLVSAGCLDDVVFMV